LVELPDYKVSGLYVGQKVASEMTASPTESLKLVEPVNKPRETKLKTPDSGGEPIKVDEYRTNDGSISYSKDTYTVEEPKGEKISGARLVAVSKKDDPYGPKLKFYKEKTE